MLTRDYEFIEEIGSGGMGTVFKARDTRTHQLVAIKQLKPEAVKADPELLERFKREGEALRQLNHPNIVKMVDAFTTEDQHYLVLEYVEGHNLRDALMEGTLTITAILNMAIDIADALTRAHRLNIIHRDIKPANLLVDQDGMVKLTDFGVAHVGTLPDITNTNVTIGTLAYLSPEACHGREIDNRADIWSFGVVLFELLAQQKPFDGNNMGEVITQVLTKPTPDLEALAPHTPIALIDLIYRMLNKNVAERIPSVRLVGAELEAILQGRPSSQSKMDVLAHLGEQTFIPDKRFETQTPASQQVKHNLPAQTTAFVGREVELQELAHLLEQPDMRLITILGVGGMGKSRISLELGEKFLARFVDGVYFVELAPLSNPDDIGSTIGEVLNFPFQKEDRSPQQQLLDYLQNKNILLILDNFEHLIAGAPFISEILKQAPQVKILATSRQALRQTGETVFHLAGLDFPEWETPQDALEYSAVKLFMQSAQRVDPAFSLQADDLPYVARICRLVQGLPLGILLAAAWLDLLTLNEIAEEISNNINFLEAELTDLPERQRSIRAVFDYSWNLLNDAEREAFQKAAIFRGGFDREAIQQITGVNLRVLQSLVNKSLLRRNTASGRYEIHELLRQFGQELLENSSNYDDVRTAHSEYFLGYLAGMTAKLKGQDQLNALNTIEQDFENIRVAWEWAVNQHLMALIEESMEALHLFTNFRSHFMIGENLFTQARSVWPMEDDKASLLAEKLAMRYPPEPSEELFRRGLAIAELHKAKPEIAFCQRLLGHWLSHTLYNQDDGVPLLKESLENYRALGDDFHAAEVLDDLGWSYRLIVIYEPTHVLFQTSIDVTEESLAIRRRIGDKIGEGNSLRNVGGAYGGFGVKVDEPAIYWEQARTLAYQLGDRLQIAWNAALLSVYWYFRGDFAKSQQYDAEAIPYADDLNIPVVRGLILIFRAMRVAVIDNNLEHSQQLLDEAYPPGTPQDFRYPGVLMIQGVLACAKGNYEDISSIIIKALDSWAFQYSNYNVLTWYTPQIILHLYHIGKLEQAVETLSLGTNHPFFTLEWAYQWPLFNEVHADLKDKLGDEAYALAWERGKDLNFKDVVDFIVEQD